MVFSSPSSFSTYANIGTYVFLYNHNVSVAEWDVEIRMIMPFLNLINETISHLACRPLAEQGERWTGKWALYKYR